MSYQHPSWREDTVYDDDRTVIAKCHYCKRPIHAESENYYADETYFNDGIWCCGNFDCKCEFLKQFQIMG